jgi:polyhydroxybutyrate depolymerase
MPDDPGPGDHSAEMEFGGQTRTFRMYVPTGYDAAVPTALVLNLHGCPSNAGEQMVFTGMNATADARGFVIVYPNGSGQSWNAGSCCDPAAAEGVDDVGFLVALVDRVAGQLCIDRARVYAAGLSNGGDMVYRLACEAPDIFAGIVPVASEILVPACLPSRPLPLIAYHGTADSSVPYAAGEAAFHRYAEAAGCVGDPVRTDYEASYCDIYEACNGGVRVGFCTLTGMDHCWPAGPGAGWMCELAIGPYSDDINANEHMWEFFGG